MEKSDLQNLPKDKKDLSASTSKITNPNIPLSRNQEIVEDEGSEMTPPILERIEPVDCEDPPAENVISISTEDLAEAGLDMDSINNLTNEQITQLMEIAERRAQREMVASQSSNNQNDRCQDYEDASNLQNDSMTIVITENGGLKVKDALNQIFFLSPSRLREMHIDVNNLTEANISNIVNNAIPAIRHSQKKTHDISEEGPYYDQEISIPSGSSQKPDPEMLQLVGNEVRIRKNNGKIATATVRYVKSGGAMKVQFDDGHFEWVTEDQLAHKRIPNDHEEYNETSIPSRVVRASTAINALKRAAAANSGARETKRANIDNFFCCPICDTKVNQKDPAYIVIRIPACDSCTKEKIFVLDTDNAREGDEI